MIGGEGEPRLDEVEVHCLCNARMNERPPNPAPATMIFFPARKWLDADELAAISALKFFLDRWFWETGPVTR